MEYDISRSQRSSFTSSSGQQLLLVGTVPTATRRKIDGDVNDVPLACAAPSRAPGASRDVLLLACCCALMVRPDDTADQLVSNVTCSTWGACVERLRQCRGGTGGRGRRSRRAVQYACADEEVVGAEGGRGSAG